MSGTKVMGPGQAAALIGAWQQIVGAQDLVGADWARRAAYQRHHHHHRRHSNDWYQYGGYGGWQPQYQPQYAPVQYRAPAPAYRPQYSSYPRPYRYGGRPWVRGDEEGAGDSGDSSGSEGGTLSRWARNALIDAPGPERAGREVLPMSTGSNILNSQSAQITARPQRVAFRPERVFISGGGTPNGAADWVVNDIKIGNRSQLSQSGDLPGDMFAHDSIDSFVSFETAQTAMDVVMVVTYIGDNEGGAPFYASIVGTAAI